MISKVAIPCSVSWVAENKGRIMSAAEVLQSVQYVVDSHGQLSAVQMSIDAWHALLDWVEDVEDRAVVKAILPRLRQGPERTGALRWDAVKDEWDTPQAK